MALNSPDSLLYCTSLYLPRNKPIADMTQKVPDTLPREETAFNS
jgi:hypothetical protein